MRQIFRLTVQGESEAEVLATLRKMEADATLSVICGQIASGTISDGSYPVVAWTYRSAVTPENARIALNQRDCMTPEAVKAYEAAARKPDIRKFIDALRQFERSATNLLDNWHDAGNETNAYPFHESFDELLHGIYNFTPAVIQAAAPVKVQPVIVEDLGKHVGDPDLIGAAGAIWTFPSGTVLHAYEFEREGVKMYAFPDCNDEYVGLTPESLNHRAYEFAFHEDLFRVPEPEPPAPPAKTTDEREPYTVTISTHGSEDYRRAVSLTNTERKQLDDVLNQAEALDIIHRYEISDAAPTADNITELLTWARDIVTNENDGERWEESDTSPESPKSPE